jgi:hypothetical protein
LILWDEEIKAHLMWIWREEDGLMKKGREGMFIITNKRIAFISKTNMTFRVHDVHSLRQLQRFQAGESVFKPLQDYGIKELVDDLHKSIENLEIPYESISQMFSEEKRWGTLLKVKFDDEGKSKTYRFSVVKAWVKYPLKDPVAFQHLDWSPLIRLFKG